MTEAVPPTDPRNAEYALPCPTCKALPGQPCYSLKAGTPLHDSHPERRAIAATTADPPLTKCPSCSVTGPDVYRADAHPIICRWMMENNHRCPEHDELLRPDEDACPYPDVPEDAYDPHARKARP